MTVPLSRWFSVRRRYTRSVNLERDLAVPGSVQGYVPTARALETLEHILDAYVTPRSARGWSVTGVYGTGKSAFAHFLTSLVAPAKDPLRRHALEVLEQSRGGRPLANIVRGRVSKRGIVRAVATAHREPVAHIVVRALLRGAHEFWHQTPKGSRPPILRKLEQTLRHARGGVPVESTLVMSLLCELADAAGTGVLVVIDELGKTLEHAALGDAGDDVYLLQQLAELSQTPSGAPVLVVTLLHQAFSEYATGLAVGQRAEWQKIQGRYEDVAFAEAPEHMLQLMAHVIVRGEDAVDAARAARRHSRAWQAHLSSGGFDAYLRTSLPADLLEAIFPLHPVAALAVPMLCAKYAQNDRSLFTFLASDEPHSFTRFLTEREASRERVPTHKLHEAYDYFVEAAGAALAFRPQFQRWAEVHGVISDARSLEPEALDALKTVGALNLIGSAGPLRASRALVLASLSDQPGSANEQGRWDAVLQRLVERGLVTYRQRTDEFRVWEGSDFDLDAAVQAQGAASPALAAVLESVAPLAPVVAHRHSYQRGTLRYFQRYYAEAAADLDAATSRTSNSDGILLYWVGEMPPGQVPATLPDGRPLILVCAAGVAALRATAMDVAALSAVQETETALQSDGVARREVRQRLGLARQALARTVRASFGAGELRCWVGGQPVTLTPTALNSRLSEACDKVYARSITLRNELINRRTLTSQGARARRELIEAMLQRGNESRLGLKGDGPEVSMYESVLGRSGIHQRVGAGWGFGPPEEPGLKSAWEAIEEFCIAASSGPRTVEHLIATVEAPPYGIREGAIPVLLAAVLLYHADDISVYREGTFLPVLGVEHFELLVKQPAKFSVKSFALRGFRLDVFRELEQVLQQHGEGRVAPNGARNSTLLSVVRPLVQFVNGLPYSTLRTTSLSAVALGVRDALRSAREPDVLLFQELPIACGVAPFTVEAPSNPAHQAEFRQALSGALRELQSASDRRLEQCKELVYTAFAVRSERQRLREDLRVRAQQLRGRTLEPRLTAFVVATTNDVSEEQAWWEALLMVVADKPFDRWGEDDVVAFELKLSDLARRFANVEAVLHDLKAPDRAGFDARRVTITAPDGREVHRLVWFDEYVRDAARRLHDDLRPRLSSIPDEQRFAVIAALAESVLASRTAGDLPAPAHAATPSSTTSTRRTNG